MAYFYYRPSKGVNTAFAVLFGISALLFLVQGIASRKRWLGFTIAMVAGCALEVVGYAGRIRAWTDLYTDVSLPSPASSRSIVWRTEN
jgi:protein-S-isoprenylcysteine O-methyltransferase Ste14